MMYKNRPQRTKLMLKNLGFSKSKGEGKLFEGLLQQSSFRWEYCEFLALFSIDFNLYANVGQFGSLVYFYHRLLALPFTDQIRYYLLIKFGEEKFNNITKLILIKNNISKS